MSYSIKELRSVSDEQLIEEHDRNAKNTSVGINYFLEELARRDTERREKRMEFLTWVILVLTVVNVVAVLAAIL